MGLLLSLSHTHAHTHAYSQLYTHAELISCLIDSIVVLYTNWSGETIQSPRLITRRRSLCRPLCSAAGKQGTLIPGRTHSRMGSVRSNNKEAEWWSEVSYADNGVVQTPSGGSALCAKSAGNVMEGFLLCVMRNPSGTKETLMSVLLQK